MNTIDTDIIDAIKCMVAYQVERARNRDPYEEFHAKEEAEAASWQDYDLFPEEDVSKEAEVAEASWDREAMLGELAKTLSPVQRARLFFGLPLQKESN